MKPLLISIFFIFSLNAKAEVNLIPFVYKGERATDTPTVFWSKKDAVATLIFLPGGSGSFGLTKKNDPKPTWVLADLNNTDFLPINLVFLDSEFSLQGNYGEPYFRWSARREESHVERIKTTIIFYKNLTKTPVFLFGHSNGSLSIAEFLNQSPDSQGLLAGVIFSGSRNETDVRIKTSIPAMVLHHQSDPNRWTTPVAAEKLFTTLKQSNTNTTIQNWVTGGTDVTGGDPTHTGRHMYNDATEEAASKILSFISSVVGK